jgi:ABC-type antimicrobial peptide transport system permease subunit
MLDDGNAPDLMETPEAPPPEEKSNRTFLIVGGIMAGAVFLTLAAMAVYLLVYAPRLNAQRSQAQATIEAGNAQVAQQVTLTALAALWTPTPSPTEIPTNTPFSSPTPVIALRTQQPTTDAAAAALSAQQTQQSINLTATAIATRAFGGSMPTTGFFDEVGLPSMIVLAVALVVVIFLARRMRKTAAK